MATDSGNDARPLPPGRAALLHSIAIAILAWGSIWIFLCPDRDRARRRHGLFIRAGIRTGQAVHRVEGIWENVWEERFTFDP